MDETQVHRFVALNISRESASHLRHWLMDIGAWNEDDDAAVAIERERYENDDRDRGEKK